MSKNQPLRLLGFIQSYWVWLNPIRFDSHPLTPILIRKSQPSLLGLVQSHRVWLRPIELQPYQESQPMRQCSLAHAYGCLNHLLGLTGSYWQSLISFESIKGVQFEPKNQNLNDNLKDKTYTHQK